MFHAWQLERDLSGAKRLSVAAVIAAGILAALFTAAVLSTARPIARLKEKKVDVSFHPLPKPVKPVPPPPVAAPKPPPAARPVAIAQPAVVAVPAAAAAIVAPKAAPTELPKPAAEPVAPIQIAVGASGDGTGTAIAATPAPAEDESPAPVIAKGGPINLPEDAEPPEPDEANESPDYPEVARSLGQEAVVILKVVIGTDGAIGKIQVLKGDQPFLEAAMSAVRAWKYSPALLDGQPISTFKIIKLPFRLRHD